LTGRLGVQCAISAHVLPAAIRLVRRFRPDLIHAHNLFFRTTEAAALLRTVFRVPLVTTLHLGKLEHGGWPLRALTRAYEATLGWFIVQRSDHIIAVSQAVAEHARRLGRGGNSVTMIPNGVDTDLFCPDGHRQGMGQTVLFVGRLVPNKGPRTLLQAVPEVLERHPSAQFLLVGDGPLRASLQKQSRQLGVEAAVHFLGIRHDVPQLMRQAALFVRPSSLEGMPLTVLEAMASGLPVVATPVGGTPELVRDEVNGYLFPVGDSKALAEAINRSLDNPAKAQEMGRQGRSWVEDRYTWDQVVEQTERVYTLVLGG
jgi:glycosyltransferase involved in cell wall biosynthesis